MTDALAASSAGGNTMSGILGGARRLKQPPAGGRFCRSSTSHEASRAIHRLCEKCSIERNSQNCRSFIDSRRAIARARIRPGRAILPRDRQGPSSARHCGNAAVTWPRLPRRLDDHGQCRRESRAHGPWGRLSDIFDYRTAEGRIIGHRRRWLTTPLNARYRTVKAPAAGLEKRLCGNKMASFRPRSRQRRISWRPAAQKRRSSLPIRLA
jgi:hypothetical protein